MSACEILVFDQHGGLLRKGLALAPGQTVELSYLHSVTHSIVRETLAADAKGFTQQQIEFSEPGPGLPDQALPGEEFVRLSDRFVFRNMNRPIGVLNMRVDPAQQQQMTAGSTVVSLTQWGRRALRLAAHNCP